MSGPAEVTEDGAGDGHVDQDGPDRAKGSDGSDHLSDLLDGVQVPVAVEASAGESRLGSTLREGLDAVLIALAVLVGAAGHQVEDAVLFHLPLLGRPTLPVAYYSAIGAGRLQHLLSRPFNYR